MNTVGLTCFMQQHPEAICFLFPSQEATIYSNKRTHGIQWWGKSYHHVSRVHRLNQEKTRRYAGAFAILYQVHINLVYSIINILYGTLILAT